MATLGGGPRDVGGHAALAPMARYGSSEALAPPGSVVQSTSTPDSAASADQVGAILVTLLALGMVVAPGVSWLLGDDVAGPALAVRMLVALLGAALAWVPLGGAVPSAWRRMLAVCLLAAHHVGVGVAMGLPSTLLVELLVGAVYIGGLGCWLLPRGGFGALLGITLALGTVALGWMPPGADPVVLGVWAGVFLLGGAAAEFSVWVGPRVRPPGDPGPPAAALEPSHPPDRAGPVSESGLALAEGIGLGVATLRGSGPELSGASRALVRMTMDWASPSTWWRQVVERGRAPLAGGGAVQIEMFTPQMRRRRAFELHAVDEQGVQRVYVQDISDLIEARRTAERLSRSLKAATTEAAAARDARTEAFRARSHNLRTPLSNMMASLELAAMSVDDAASLGVIREDLEAARESAELLHQEVNQLVESIFSDAQDRSEESIDLVALVDQVLDGLGSSREVRRSYAEASLSIRGVRSEVISVVQDVVRGAVAACRAAVGVRVERLDGGDAQVGFRCDAADVELVRGAVRDFGPRISVLGGRLALDGVDGPALVLPEGGRVVRGVEAEVTWPGAVPVVDGPHLPRIDTDIDDTADDDPTYIAYARHQAWQTAPKADDGPDGSR